MAWEMPLEWLAGMVGVGVPAAILLSHLQGGSRFVPLDAASLQELVAVELPGAAIQESLVCPQAHCALLALTDGRMAVAWAMEGHRALRTLEGVKAATASPQGLRLDLGDPAWPARTLDCSPEQAQRWAERISPKRSAA